MSNLRAPDPVLEGLGDDIVDVALLHPVPFAHRVNADCGFVLLASLEAKHAAYFTVPCPVCFPDATPPGTFGPCCGNPEECPRGGWWRDKGLAWQTP